MKKGVLKDFTKFTGKHLCQSLFLIKLQVSCLRLIILMIMFLETSLRILANVGVEITSSRTLISIFYGITSDSNFLSQENLRTMFWIWPF